MNGIYYCMCAAAISFVCFETVAGKTINYYFDELVEEPKTEEKLFDVNLNIRKTDITEFLVSADVNELAELKNDTQIGISLSCADHNDDKSEYVVLFEYPITHLCDFMDSDYVHLYNQFKDYSNMPAPSTCPVPSQKYTVTDAPLSLESISRMLFPAKYRMDINLYRDNQLLVSYLFYGRITQE